MTPTRRMFLSAGAAGLASALLGRTQGMSLHLSCGAIGVKASQTEAIEYAAKYGFDSVDADGAYLQEVEQLDLAQLLDTMRAKKVGWAIAGLPAEVRPDNDAYNASIKRFPKYCEALKRAGVRNITTWISPASKDRIYMENMELHARRFRQIADMMDAQNLRLGLEYVGPKTLWSSQRYPFVHTMAEMKYMLAEIGRDNVGFVLDSWHWYTSGETQKDLLSLKGKVISVDLNDAPAGIPVDQQIDSKRELPASTGVIDVGAFLGALKEIEFTGPVRVEPFNEAIRKMPPDKAVATAKAALDKAFAKVA